LIKEIKGTKIGFLGYKGWSSEKRSNELLVKHVKEMRERGVNFIIANYHWGDMYSYKPNIQQRNMARFAVDNGVDLVIGHHPHVLQGMENYKGKNIVYSLGNFCYGGKMNPKDKDTIIFQQLITFDTTKNEIIGTECRIIPASLSSRTDINNFQPIIAVGDEAERILKKYEKLSKELN
ncbi:MAG: CapA family protein, partial [Clostridiaceae bacterium]|nr:CapA family protein [Clostridiaceae bacterium]